jgi:hypothetical protein
MDIVEQLDEHLRFNGKDQLSRDAKGEIERLRETLKRIEYLDRPQIRGLPCKVSIHDIALAALKGEK